MAEATIEVTPELVRFINTAVAYAKALSETWPASDVEPETYYTTGEAALDDLKQAFVASYMELPE